MRLLLEKWNKYILETKDMKRVSKAVMLDKKGNVLILKRSPDSVSEDSPWEWDLPGGHIHEGESDVKGLQREIQEETSLYISRAPDWFMLEKHTRFFLIREWKGEITLSDEHTEYKWVAPREVTKYNIGKMYENAVAEAAVRS